MSETPHARGVRVLVVDDYQPFADLLVGVLWNHGYETRAAYSAEEALSAAMEFTPHALVVDVILPDGDGFKVAEECKQRIPGCRVLLTSAWDYTGESEKMGERIDVVPKAALMDMLFDFLDARTRLPESRGC